MERLTQRRNDTPVPNKALGDLCWRMSFCEEFDFCEGCPVGKLLNRLCEYEETGLTPNDIEKLKKSADAKTKNQRIRIVGMVKSTVLKQRVSRYGLHINGKKYYLADLANYHIGEIASVVIYKHKAKVYIDNLFVEEFEL